MLEFPMDDKILIALLSSIVATLMSLFVQLMLSRRNANLTRRNAKLATKTDLRSNSYREFMEFISINRDFSSDALDHKKNEEFSLIKARLFLSGEYFVLDALNDFLSKHNNICTEEAHGDYARLIATMRKGISTREHHDTILALVTREYTKNNA
jgi:hypothetical protein